MIRLLAIFPALVALAACGEEPTEAPADDRRGAEGEVLGGTISDAMLPLPTVRSQSPPLESSPASPAAAGPPAEGGEPTAASSEPEPEAEATPEETED